MENYAVRYALDLLSGRWKLYIMYALASQSELRFNELQRRVGAISASMLSKNLSELEAQKLIVRHEYGEIPPHVGYSLSELGLELVPAFHSLGDWGQKVYQQKEKGAKL